jgi:hypothetical protein
VWPDPQQGYVTVGNLATAPGANLHVYQAETGVTSSVLPMLRLEHQSNVATASGFGSSLGFAGRSSTTAGRDMADITAVWATATDATRKGRLSLNVWDTAAREALRLESSGSAPMIGLYGVTAVARQTVAATATDLTSAITLVNDLRSKLITLGAFQ